MSFLSLQILPINLFYTFPFLFIPLYHSLSSRSLLSINLFCLFFFQNYFSFTCSSVFLYVYCFDDDDDIVIEGIERWFPVPKPSEVILLLPAGLPLWFPVTAAALEEDTNHPIMTSSNHCQSLSCSFSVSEKGTGAMIEATGWTLCHRGQRTDVEKSSLLPFPDNSLKQCFCGPGPTRSVASEFQLGCITPRAALI